jgi:hypothetical protein
MCKSLPSKDKAHPSLLRPHQLPTHTFVRLQSPLHVILYPFTGHSQNDAQRDWLYGQLQRHPIRTGQTPTDWVLWRARVSEGMSEMAAWESVVNGASQAHASPSQAYTMDFNGESANQEQFTWSASSNLSLLPVLCSDEGTARASYVEMIKAV